jgi:hypothetical protein
MHEPISLRRLILLAVVSMLSASAREQRYAEHTEA